MQTRQIQELLTKTFGLTEFRHRQQAIIEAILQGEDTLVVMPTGSGKSLCYQLPALLLEGVTLVISLLIALMKDQVDRLQRRRITATFINSTLPFAQVMRRIDEVRQGRYKLLYIAPERFESAQFMRLLQDIRVSLIAVDEAHCISQWGHDFRPSYLKLKDIIERAGRPPVAALTATATRLVQQDIIDQLRLRKPKIFVTGFDRPNLKFFAIELTKDLKEKELLRILPTIKGSGIVYVATQKAVAEVTTLLKQHGLNAIGYHGGMEKEERERAQTLWLREDVPIIVATNAFGMGIDKPNVRFVLHYNMPGSVEAYYQEAGRAGRDGKTAYCILFHSYHDRRIQEFFIENSYPPEAQLRELYHFLFSLGRREIYLTYREIGEHVSMNEAAVASAIKLFERYHILKRMNQQALTYQVFLQIPPEEAKKAIRRSELQQKLFDWLQRHDGERILLEATLRALAITQEQFSRTMAQLVNKGLVTYIPPFRGRGLLLTSELVRWEKVPIDFEAYEKNRKRQFQRLDDMQAYAGSQQCRRAFLLNYFGETYRHKTCHACDICLDWTSPTVEQYDRRHQNDHFATILRCIDSMDIQYGVETYVDLLRGQFTDRTQRGNLTESPFFGTLASLSADSLRRMIYKLIQRKWLSRSTDTYPVLSLTPEGREYLIGKQIPMSMDTGTRPAERSTDPAAQEDLIPYPDLYERLRDLRGRLAYEADLPAYAIFTDRSLQELVLKLPRSQKELEQIYGFGAKKVKKYGKPILSLIRYFLRLNPEINRQRR